MWQQYIYSGPAGSRPYLVYTPANYQPGAAVPLLVMLHGCTQTPLDFAAGTQMNKLADQQNFIVVYPQQTTAYSRYACWNWYDSANQARGSGEPAIIAGIVQTMQSATAQWSIDPRRIYVAGLSAGAALSVILGATYPDIFAAIGVHSGFEYQATSMPNGVLRVSRRGGPDPSQQGQAAYAAMGALARIVPTIVFHGTRDHVINPINGDQAVQQWIATNMLASNDSYVADFDNPASTTPGQVPGGRSYTTYTWDDKNGHEILAYWKVNGMGHAWSGGSYGGSYSDPQGPDASQAIYSFFMNHSLLDHSASNGHRPFLVKVQRLLRDLFQVQT